MPVYTICPHCQHPVVVPGPARGKGRLCKQCGQAYRVSRAGAMTQALRARSAGDLLRLSGGGRSPSLIIL